MIHLLRIERHDDQGLAQAGQPDGQAHPVAGSRQNIERRNVRIAKTEFQFTDDQLHSLRDVSQVIDGAHVRGSALDHEPDR